MHSTPQNLAPSITFLNMSGDVTISWRPEEKLKVADMVERKMKEGYSFFIVSDPLSPTPPGRKREVQNGGDLYKDGVGAVRINPSVNGKVLADEELARAMDAGIIYVTRNAEAPAQQRTKRRAKTAEEVVDHQTVAVRPVQGG